MVQPNRRKAMMISRTMNLTDLAERMGAEAAASDAAAMRDLLVERHDGHDTADISESEWLDMLNEAVA